MYYKTQIHSILVLIIDKLNSSVFLDEKYEVVICVVKRRGYLFYTITVLVFDARLKNYFLIILVCINGKPTVFLNIMYRIAKI